MIWLACTVSFVAGIALQWALSRRRIRQGKAAPVKFLLKMSGPAYVDPTEFSHNWERRA